MKAWKQPTLWSRNINSLNGCIMILETNKQEDEEYMFYYYKTNDYSAIFQNIKGVILASSGISNSLFSDDYKNWSFTMDNNQYKSTAKIYLKNYLVSVVVPFRTQDNILSFICNEFISFCDLFFENFDDSKKFTNILNKYAEILFYFTSNYILNPINEDIIGTPISLLPIINLTFTYNEINPIFLIKPGITDPIRADLMEHMNSLIADRSVLQETWTLMDPPFYVKGYLLLYRGFVLFNTLDNKEILNGARLAVLHGMYMRSQSSPEILSCEFWFDTLDNSNCSGNASVNKKKTLTTLLAQREFVMLVSLEILGKNNCTFDPFYHKRAEDWLVNLWKKNFSSIISNELLQNSIKMNNLPNCSILDSQWNNNNNLNEGEKSIGGFKEIETVISNKSRKNSKEYSEKEKEKDKDKDSILDMNKENENTLNSWSNKIKGYIDPETGVNIIHFSCYDDSECVINTTDLNVTTTLFRDWYQYIFRIYSMIQSNLNKIKSNNKQIKLNKLFSYDELKSEHILRKEVSTKTKITKNSYAKSIAEINNQNGKYFKINEYGVNWNNEIGMSVWICCKVYEHITIDDDINMDEFSNFKIIFVAYESWSPVEIDSFCQDLLMNELFI